MSAGATRVAVRRRLPPGATIDPYTLAGAEGVVFDTGHRVLVGVGRALTVALDGGLDDPDGLRRARQALAAIPYEDHSGLGGSGIVALGALPFDRSAPGSLVVPEVTYGREADGSEWVTVLGTTTGDDPLGELLAQARRPGAAAVTTSPAPVVEPLSSDADFLEAVASAVEAIHGGRLSKVVLARQVDVHLGGAPDLPELLARWRRLEPNCTGFSMPAGDGRFVGASPELLLARHGRDVLARPLAGTSGQGSEATDTALRRSAKDAGEHRLVVEAIAAVLVPRCASLDVPARPELVHLHNVVHLGTTIQGVLREDGDHGVPTALDLVGALHPTPAVGGVPLAAALEAIDRLESGPRGAYAGPVGYLDAEGDGEWVVGIRAATLHGDTARLAAGVGIVDGSDPASELAETDLKFTAVFDALAPGARFSTAPARTVV